MLRRAAALLVVLVVLIALAWFGGRAWLARSVAQTSGEIRAAVAAPVDVVFDAKGVPQIWARTDADASYAMGWLHASDRLFQMELVRRLVEGELSEVFGTAAFDTDARQRRLGFARRARRDSPSLSPRARMILQRYVDGVNAYVAQAKVIAPELVILRVKPRPWTVEDCIAVSAYQTWYAHELMDADERFQTLAARLGAPGLALIHAGHPWSPPTVGSEFVSRTFGATGLRATGASNSWAVSPRRSQSGHALHAADPHLAVDQAPGLWYLAGIHTAEGWNAAGATYAGAPFVVMGHTSDIAYSFTVASVDLNDYYEDRPLRTIARESIVVKGEKKPRVVDVKEGARGVMLDDTTSLKWAGFDFSSAELVDSALRLQHATNFDEFRRAVTRFGALDVNWVYSDRNGHIGYQLASPIPIRSYDTYLRQKASDPRSAWQGYRALDETPHSLDPSEGFVASSNNNIVGPDWPYPIPGFYDPYRIPRSRALLSSKPILSAADMKPIQLDLVSGIATRWKSLAAAGARRAGLTREADALTRWNGAMTPGSREATLFELWWSDIPREVFEDDLGTDWTKARGVIDQALTTRSPLIDDKRTAHVETIDEISARAMQFAAKKANGRTWGEASTLVVNHPLARVRLLDLWLHLDRGPLPAPGDAGTLDANFNSYDEATNSFQSHVGPSMRFVLDWANVDGFTITAALGQSGNPFSPHYADFLPLMRRGESWPMPFTRPAVLARAASVLRLVPTHASR